MLIVLMATCLHPLEDTKMNGNNKHGNNGDKRKTVKADTAKLCSVLCVQNKYHQIPTDLCVIWLITKDSCIWFELGDYAEGPLRKFPTGEIIFTTHDDIASDYWRGEAKLLCNTKPSHRHIKLLKDTQVYVRKSISIWPKHALVRTHHPHAKLLIKQNKARWVKKEDWVCGVLVIDLFVDGSRVQPLFPSGGSRG
jgi:hypothetical protein